MPHRHVLAALLMCAVFTPGCVIDAPGDPLDQQSGTETGDGDGDTPGDTTGDGDGKTANCNDLCW